MGEFVGKHILGFGNIGKNLMNVIDLLPVVLVFLAEILKIIEFFLDLQSKENTEKQDQQNQQTNHEKIQIGYVKTGNSLLRMRDDHQSRFIIKITSEFSQL
jgi:hypothetical protein